MSILKDIVLNKRQEVAEMARRVPLNRLKRRSRQTPIRDFPLALARPGIQIIAEVKRRSPSSGDIRPEADPSDLAKQYSENGAAAISILTDKKYFGGSVEHLKRVKESTSLPVLRKDFVIAEYQVYESYLAGADAILLIVDILEPELLTRLHRVATDLGLAVLVELYSTDHLPLVRELHPQVVGVNSRNLESMKTDLRRCVDIFSSLPDNSLKVSESGIRTTKHLRLIEKAGYDAALVGTELMRSPSAGQALRNLLDGVRQ